MIPLSVMWLLSEADVAAALRDVAGARPGLLLDERRPVDSISGVHLQVRQADEEPSAGEDRLVFGMVTDDGQDVLAEEALDTLPELLESALHATWFARRATRG